MCFVPGTEQSVGCNGGDVAHILAVIHHHQNIIMFVALFVFVLFGGWVVVFGAWCVDNDRIVAHI